MTSKPIELNKRKNMRKVYPAVIIEILEGNGTKVDPFEIYKYVMVDNNIIGRVNHDVAELPTKKENK